MTIRSTASVSAYAMSYAVDVTLRVADRRRHLEVSSRRAVGEVVDCLLAVVSAADERPLGDVNDVYRRIEPFSESDRIRACTVRYRAPISRHEDCLVHVEPTSTAAEK